MTMTINGSGTITGLTAGGLPDGSVVQVDLAAGVVGNGPCFSAYASASTSMASNAFTKIAYQTEEFDTNNNFDSTTNYRFTPTVAGYYQVNATFQTGASSLSQVIALYRNGTVFKKGGIGGAAVSSSQATVLSVLVFMNGTTDYLEIFGYQNSGGAQGISTTASDNYFQAVLVRAA